MPYSKRFAETLYSRDFLQREYVDAGRNAAQVAKMIGCSKGAVIKAAQRFGLPTRSAAEAQVVALHPGSHVPRPRAKFAETLHSRVWMEAKWASGMTATDIAREAGCSVPTACKTLQKMFGMSCRPSTTPPERLREMRGRSEARRKHARQPCLLCGEKGTLNHRDKDPTNNNDSNIEWLCAYHHFALDKRRSFYSERILRAEYRDRWDALHDLILAELRDEDARGVPRPIAVVRRTQQVEREKLGAFLGLEP